MNLPPITPTAAAMPLARVDPPEDAATRSARATAEAFETAFLTEMLKHAGINQTPEATGGGAGEDAFSSFLTEEYARLITARGGVGVAEQIFNAIHHKGSGT